MESYFTRSISSQLGRDLWEMGCSHSTEGENHRPRSCRGWCASRGSGSHWLELAEHKKLPGWGVGVGWTNQRGLPKLVETAPNRRLNFLLTSRMGAQSYHDLSLLIEKCLHRMLTFGMSWLPMALSSLGGHGEAGKLVAPQPPPMR